MVACMDGDEDRVKYLLQKSDDMIDKPKDKYVGEYPLLIGMHAIALFFFFFFF